MNILKFFFKLYFVMFFLGFLSCLAFDYYFVNEYFLTKFHRSQGVISDLRLDIEKNIIIKDRNNTYLIDRENFYKILNLPQLNKEDLLLNAKQLGIFK